MEWRQAAEPAYAVPDYGEHAWDYVRHHIMTSLFGVHVFVFDIRDYKEMFNVPWTLKIVSFPKFVMRFY